MMLRTLILAAWLWLLGSMDAQAQMPGSYGPPRAYPAADCPCCQAERVEKPGLLCRKAGRDPYGQPRMTLGEKLDRKSCGYGKGLGDFGCGSLRQTCIFIFGSCYDFFEEPCRRQPRR
ncbi:MAG TPA: hypothetical protein PKC45_16185 [Gemmatales bacterium]|nr:hypothetical protein [Gemmatales bacterium]